MTEDIFWQLIEKAKNSSKDDFRASCENLIEYLTEYSVDDIVSFDNILSKKIKKATTYKMLLACFIINSYISDDTFEYFCGWLIGQGKDNYEAGVADPNYFCKLLEKGDRTNQDGEYLTTVAVQAFEEKTHKDSDIFYDQIEYYDEPEIRRLTTIDNVDYRNTLPLLFDKFWEQEVIDKRYK